MNKIGQCGQKLDTEDENWKLNIMDKITDPYNKLLTKLTEKYKKLEMNIKSQ